jgi:hypothetical protein
LSSSTWLEFSTTSTFAFHNIHPFRCIIPHLTQLKQGVLYG